MQIILTYYDESANLWTMNAVIEARRRRHFSQRALAARAGVSFRGLQLLEQDGHEWRSGTLARVAQALDLPGAGVNLVVERFLQTVPDSLAAATFRMLLEGFDSWKTHLFDFVDTFRSAPSASAELLDPPAGGLDARLQALCASTVEALCAEKHMQAPAWCSGAPPLAHPWFVAGIENLKAMALVESPAWFRSRNIFVLGNFLKRA